MRKSTQSGSEASSGATVKRTTILIDAVSVIIAVASILWLYFDPGLESLIASLGALVVVVGIGAITQIRLSKILDESLEKRLYAIREIRRVVSNIPEVARRELIQKLSADDAQFRNQLTSRLVRLLGLRIELAPYIEPELADLIDTEFEPLFIVELGRYTFRDDRVHEFSVFAEKVVRMVRAIEKGLTKEYRRRFD